MADLSPKYLKDLGERVAFTAVEAAVAVVVTESAGWPTWIAVPLAAGLAAVKGWLARHVGNSDSAGVVK